MSKAIERVLDNTFGLALNGMTEMLLAVRRNSRFLQREVQRVFPLFLAILVGGGIGGLAIFANNASTKWAGVVVIAAVAPSVVLLVKDVKKLILIALLADMPFGIDLAIQNQGRHQGGPTGYIVSLMAIVLIVGYAIWIIERRPKPRFLPEVTIPALLYLFMSALSLYQSANWQLTSFGLFLKCQVFLMYFYVINHVKTWDAVRLIATTAAICLLVESTLMVLQYFTGATLDIGGLVSSGAVAESSGGAGVTGARVAGTLKRAGNAALYLNSMLPLTFGAYLTGKLVDKRLALAAFSLGVIALITTSSRGGWVAFVVGMLILLGQAVRTGVGRKAILLFLVGGLLVGIFFGGQIQKRFVTVTEDTTRERLAFMAYNIIKAYPLGVGDNNYDQVMSDKYAHPAWVGHTLYPPHNKYLIIWAEMGFQGLIAFVLFLVASVWQAGRWLFRNDVSPHLTILAVSLLSGLTAYMIHMRSETLNGRSQIQLLWFIIAMIVVVNQLITQSEQVSVSGT